MGIFDIFRGKKDSVDNEQRHELSEADRELSLRQRQINAELKRTQREIEITEAKLRLQSLKDDLASMQGETDEEEPDSFESAISPYIPELMPAVVNFLNGKTNNQNVSQPSPQSNKIILSQEQINDYFKENKKYIKIAKRMSDEQIKTFLTNRVPDLSDQTVGEIITRVRSS